MTGPEKAAILMITIGLELAANDLQVPAPGRGRADRARDRQDLDRLDRQARRGRARSLPARDRAQVHQRRRHRVRQGDPRALVRRRPSRRHDEPPLRGAQARQPARAGEEDRARAAARVHQGRAPPDRRADPGLHVARPGRRRALAARARAAGRGRDAHRHPAEDRPGDPGTVGRAARPPPDGQRLGLHQSGRRAIAGASHGLRRPRDREEHPRRPLAPRSGGRRRSQEPALRVRGHHQPRRPRDPARAQGSRRQGPGAGAQDRQRRPAAAGVQEHVHPRRGHAQGRHRGPRPGARARGRQGPAEHRRRHPHARGERPDRDRPRRQGRRSYVGCV